MSTASANLDLSLVIVFSTYIREKHLKLGIYLIDVVLKLIVPIVVSSILSRTVSCSDFQEAL